MTQQEAYKILGITEEEIEAAGAVPEGTKAAGASTETSQSFDNAFQNFNRQAVERLIKKKYRQRILSAHPDVQPEEETEYSAQLLNYAYAYLKKNGWYDGHVSKKSYQVKSRASKTQVWDAPVNLRAWREREIYSYAEDSEGEKIGYFFIAAGKYMLENGGGSIINTASMSAHIVNVPQPQCAYNASKAGVIQLTKSLAIEWAKRGVRVNSISPGYIGTELTLNSPTLIPLIEKWNEMAPMGRMGKPEELEAICVYLAGDASSFTTGSDIVVDGAFTCF